MNLVQTWGMDIVSTGTNRRDQVIAVEWKKFKKIWGTNPQKGPVDVPAGLEGFVDDMEVTEVRG